MSDGAKYMLEGLNVSGCLPMDNIVGRQVLLGRMIGDAIINVTGPLYVFTYSKIPSFSIPQYSNSIASGNTQANKDVFNRFE